MLAKGKNQLKLNESEIVKKSKIMKTVNKDVQSYRLR